MTTATSTAATSTGRRVALAVSTLVLVGVDLGGKALAETMLADGNSRDLGLLMLQLTYNSGVAFSLGAALPPGLITAVTGLVTLAIAIYAWRTAPATPLLSRIGLAAVLAGAAGNVIDRAGDGLVTDYLHTGWFPTFNLADTLITCGAVVIVLTNLRDRGQPDPTGDPTPDPGDREHPRPGGQL